MQRLVGCSSGDWDHATRAVRTWLLVGCLGYRANRAAGSVWPADNSAPRDAAALVAELRHLGLNWPIRISDPAGEFDATELRKTASDTINKSCFFGAAGTEREPSPVRFKVLSFDGAAALLAIAPLQEVPVDGRREQLVDAALGALRDKHAWAALKWKSL
jgi:hypothetical protein